MTDRGGNGFFYDFFRLNTTGEKREELINNIRLAILFSTF